VADLTPEVLAAEFDAAANAFDKDVRDHGEDLDVGCRDTLRGCADRVRTMLAPAHAALAAELAQARQAHDTWAAQLTAERDRYRAALEAIAECRAGMPYPVLAREALGGGHG